MTDERPVPGERRLAHPPSDRYRAAEVAAAARSAKAAGPARPVSPVRGVIHAVMVVIGGAIAITVLGGVVTLTTGLVILAAGIGWSTARALGIGAGATLAPTPRTVIAVVMALGCVSLGQLGLWIYAGVQGGVLPLVDYLDQAFGFVVPAQIAIAPLTAWISAR